MACTLRIYTSLGYLAILVFQAAILRTQEIENKKPVIIVAKEPIVLGVVDKNVTLEWTYQSAEGPAEVSFYVGYENSTIQPLWILPSNKVMQKYSVMETDKEAVFNNNTQAVIEGGKIFRLIIYRVPHNIESFKIVCLVKEGVWSPTIENQIHVKLAKPPIVDFQIQGDNKNFAAGKPLHIVCLAKGNPVPAIVTIKRIIKPKTEVLSRSKGNATHTIKSLQPSDNGKYICIAENIAKTVEKELLVVVTYKPVVTFTFDPDSLDVLRGGELKMFCNATGFPKPEMLLQQTLDTGVQTIQNSTNEITYSLSNIQPEDASKYICSARNPAGVAKKEKRLLVRYIQINSGTRKSFAVEIGTRLKLNCDIVGFPSIEYTWYKGKTELTTQEKVFDVPFNADSNFGDYTCKGSNSAGHHIIMFSVSKAHLHKKAQVKLQFVAKIGEKKRLICPIIGHPKVSHSWLRGNRKVGDGESLTVNLDDKDKFGKYECRGKNRLGEASAVFTLEQEPTKEQRDVESASSTVSVTVSLFLLTLITLLRNM